MDKKPVFVKLFLKHDDRTYIGLLDLGLKPIEEQESGYLPYVGILGGDDTDLLIDNETGRIVGWQPLNTLQMEKEGSW